MQYEKDIQSEFKALFLQARELLVTKHQLIETKKTRITTYSDMKGAVCHMRTMPYGIDFGFLKGAKMEDDYQALTGNGKLVRVLPQKGILKIELIEYYLKQASELNL
ncbi:MAG: DUF1801 domain-containing protein [Alteromonadales bacterium]|nr:DUF1801 domain-containing protein [Alteromonadales bacterium]